MALLEHLAELHPLLLCAAALGFMCVETSLLVGLFVPGDAVVLLAGTTVGSPARYALLVAATTAGCLAGRRSGTPWGAASGRRSGGAGRAGGSGRPSGPRPRSTCAATVAPPCSGPGSSP
ncbi:hypothetical protein ACFQ0B_09095 [Nonomuraea thailandensis]